MRPMMHAHTTYYFPVHHLTVQRISGEPHLCWVQHELRVSLTPTKFFNGITPQPNGNIRRHQQALAMQVTAKPDCSRLEQVTALWTSLHHGERVTFRLRFSAKFDRNGCKLKLASNLASDSILLQQLTHYTGDKWNCRMLKLLLYLLLSPLRSQLFHCLQIARPQEPADNTDAMTSSDCGDRCLNSKPPDYSKFEWATQWHNDIARRAELLECDREWTAKVERLSYKKGGKCTTWIESWQSNVYHSISRLNREETTHSEMSHEDSVWNSKDKSMRCCAMKLFEGKKQRWKSWG